MKDKGTCGRMWTNFRSFITIFTLVTQETLRSVFFRYMVSAISQTFLKSGAAHGVNRLQPLCDAASERLVCSGAINAVDP